MAKRSTKVVQKVVELKPDLGLPAEAQKSVVDLLKVVLADETLLYQKLRNYHWNVTGPHFFALHAAFEEQYNEIADVIDEVAERIRQFGVYTPGTMEELKGLARLTERPGVYPSADAMVAELCGDHETMIRNLREDIETIDDETDEVGAEDLLTGLLQQHQKMAWMLRMNLQGSE